jgi:hypothetical protein
LFYTFIIMDIENKNPQDPEQYNDMFVLNAHCDEIADIMNKIFYCIPISCCVIGAVVLAVVFFT